MGETADVQGEVVGLGTVAAVAVLAYGTLVNETLVGVDTMVVAGWVLVLTLATVALLHASVGQYDLTWGFGGAAVGLLFVFAGSGSAVLVGLLLLGLSGLYIALVTNRLRRASDPTS